MFPPIGPRLNACVRFWPNTVCGSFSEPQGIDFFPEKNKRKKEEEKVGVDQRETGFLKVFATYACAHSCSKINSETQTTPNAKFFFFFFVFANAMAALISGRSGYTWDLQMIVLASNYPPPCLYLSLWRRKKVSSSENPLTSFCLVVVVVFFFLNRG